MCVVVGGDVDAALAAVAAIESDCMWVYVVHAIEWEWRVTVWCVWECVVPVAFRVLWVSVEWDSTKHIRQKSDKNEREWDKQAIRESRSHLLCVVVEWARLVPSGDDGMKMAAHADTSDHRNRRTRHHPSLSCMLVCCVSNHVTCALSTFYSSSISYWHCLLSHATHCTTATALAASAICIMDLAQRKMLHHELWWVCRLSHICISSSICCLTPSHWHPQTSPHIATIQSPLCTHMAYAQPMQGWHCANQSTASINAEVSHCAWVIFTCVSRLHSCESHTHLTSHATKHHSLDTLKIQSLMNTIFTLKSMFVFQCLMIHIVVSLLCSWCFCNLLSLTQHSFSHNRPHLHSLYPSMH